MKRTPIIVPTLSWEEIYDKFVNLIKYASGQVIQNTNSGLISSEDLFQEGQLLLYECFMKYGNKSMEEFTYLFKASLWRKLRDVCNKESKWVLVDIEDAYDIGYTDEVVENMYENYLYQQVAEILKDSPIALTIFKEFVNPSLRTVWEAKMDVARKEMSKLQGKLKYSPNNVVINKTHIQKALEVSTRVFNENFNMVKDAVSVVYGYEYKIA